MKPFSFDEEEEEGQEEEEKQEREEDELIAACDRELRRECSVLSRLTRTHGVIRAV